MHDSLAVIKILTFNFYVVYMISDWCKFLAHNFMHYCTLLKLFLISVGYETICINNYVDELSVKTSKKSKDKVLHYKFTAYICYQ